MNITLNRVSKVQQYIISIASVIVIAAICFILSDYLGYHVVTFVLLVTVSLSAMFFDIFPVLLTALLSALIWQFFFIPPRFTFSIGSTEDTLLLAMYFVIASINAVLTFKIRQMEKQVQQREEKEKSVKLYNTLLNSLSHELRTPIATIIGATDNLMANNSRLTTDNRSDLIGEISKASLRLNRQVENLLNMSRIESGFLKPKKDWVDVNELIYEVVNRLKDFTQHHPISVMVKDTLPLFKLDFGLMDQVLYNLIYNASLYIPRYCVISVKALCVNEKLFLIVEDTGNGFPPEETSNVFNKFYRLKNSQTGGTGLGLSIVKGIVEAHDGNKT